MIVVYLALRECHKQGFPPPTIENLPELNLKNIKEEETERGILLENITSTGFAVVCLKST